MDALDKMIRGTTSSFQYRITINSVESARPSASAAVAKGLGLPISTVVSRLYRTPAALTPSTRQTRTSPFCRLDSFSYMNKMKGQPWWLDSN